jgi:L-alanine-DL-glutamate epimerase-like enolase superfamily enzyme
VKVDRIDVYTIALPFDRPERWSSGARLGCANVLIKLTTDDGLVGWGETSGGSGGSVAAVRAAVDACRSVVQGMDPFQVEHLRSRLFSAGRWRNLHRLANLVLAGYEIAFYDLMGKACQRPASDFLGGRVRDSVSIYGYVLTAEQPIMVSAAVDLAKRGFTTLYMKGGWDTEQDAGILAAIREAVSSSVRIRIDANEALSPAAAISWISRLSEFNLEFVEQPTPALDLEGMRRTRDASPVPIAANQGLWSVEEVLQVIRAGAADILVTGPLWVGGLLSLKKVAAIAEAAGLPFCRHAPPETGIATAAGLQVLATLPQLMDGNQIYLGQVLLEDVVCGGLDPAEQGHLAVPAGPGLGVDVDEQVVRRLAALYDTHGDFAQVDERVLAGRQ